MEPEVKRAGFPWYGQLGVLVMLISGLLLGVSGGISTGPLPIAFIAGAVLLAAGLWVWVRRQSS